MKRKVSSPPYIYRFLSAAEAAARTIAARLTTAHTAAHAAGRSDRRYRTRNGERRYGRTVNRENVTAAVYEFWSGYYYRPTDFFGRNFEYSRSVGSRKRNCRARRHGRILRVRQYALRRILPRGFYHTERTARVKSSAVYEYARFEIESPVAAAESAGYGQNSPRPQKKDGRLESYDLAYSVSVTPRRRVYSVC